MRVAIVGCGEVGSAYARAAVEAGWQVAVVDPRPTAASVELAAELGISTWRQAGPEALAAVDRVWICVTGEAAKSVFCDALAHLPASAVVVDLTTAAAADKRECDRMARAAGRAYVDVVIMGAVAITGARTPLLGAGPGVELVLAEFEALGARVRALQDAQPGDAATIKLLRTILTKGLESLAVECLVAAEREGVRELLYEVMSDVDEMGFVPFLNMLVQTHVQHAGRRLLEVRRAQIQLAEMGSESVVLPGCEARFARTVETMNAAPPSPAGSSSVAAAIERLLGRG
ncbi:MAG: NAD(P)-binding domain-containing protein [Nocardioidaceae bacterium]